MIERKNEKKVIATILVAVIAISGITVAFAANNDGLVGPKDILPGAITSMDIKDNDIQTCDIATDAVTSAELAANSVRGAEISGNSVRSAMIVDNTITAADIATDAVKSEEIGNGAIDDEDLGDAAIPSVVLNDTGVKTGLTNTWWEDFNTTITTGRKMAFIFTYAANLTKTTQGNALLAKACVVGQSDPTAYSRTITSKGSR